MKDFLNGRKRRPTHPGEALREDLMPAAGLTQGQLAKALGVSRLTISEIVLEKRAVTPDIAIRLAKYFGTSPELWIGLQKDVDLWDAMQANRKVYDRIKPRKRRAAA
jgi:addiction module HigA family antidote